MAIAISPVKTSARMPRRTGVAIIGGGIVGLSAALTLAERGIAVTVLEKGRIAGEQSSRNLGWVRKTIRHAVDLPLAIAAEQLWHDMPERVGSDVGYTASGIMYVARTRAEMDSYEEWFSSVSDFGFDTRLLTPEEIDNLAPGGNGSWIGGIYTPSDGRAEPTLAPSAIARAAMAKGAVIVENCAARSLVKTGGRVSGVMTETGELQCDQVILAGGVMTRRFLGNEGLSFPTLPVVASVIRTAPMDGPTDIAVGGPDFSFRKGVTGGYTIIQRAALSVPLIADSLLVGHRYLPLLKSQWKNIRISLSREALDDMPLARRWQAGDQTPFERRRTIDPRVDRGLIAEALRNASRAWPVFETARIERTWAGMIDVTPDSLPVICNVEQVPGLTVASGFSGHGFGTGPAAGQLAADLATGSAPLVDPAPYRFDRF